MVEMVSLVLIAYTQNITQESWMEPHTLQLDHQCWPSLNNFQFAMTQMVF